MSGGTRIPTIHKLLVEDDYKLREKDLYLTYIEFSKPCVPGDDINCSDILAESLNGRMRKLYKQFVHNFHKLKDTENLFKRINGMEKKGCTYLKYWLYDRFIYNKYSDDDIQSFFNSWELSMKSLFDEQCECKLHRMNLDELQRIKNLYDYFLFYDGYGSVDLVSHKIYSSSYCSYLQGAENIYNNMKIECVDNNKEYCKEFNDLRKHINVDMNKIKIILFKGNCKNEITGTFKKTNEPKNMLINPLLKGLIENENLEHVPLYEFYKLINKVANESIEHDICNVVIPSNTINGGYLRKYCNLIKLLLKEWDSNSHIVEKSEDKNKICEYFSYWIRQEIKEKKYRNMFLKLLHLFRGFPNNENNKCIIKFFNVGENEFKKKKALHEFLEFFDIIINKMSNGKDEKVDKCCEYIKSNFQLYYLMLQEDKCKKSSKYEDEILLFQEKFRVGDDISTVEEKCSCNYLDLLYKDDLENKYSSPTGSAEFQAEAHDPNQDNVAHTGVEFKGISPEIQEVMKELPLSKIYDEMNDEKNIENYCSDCMDILFLELKYPGINKFCRLLSKNLRNLSERVNEDNNDRCEYYNHWVIDEIKKRFKKYLNTSFDTPFVKSILNVVYNINNKLGNNRCSFNFNFDSDYDELREMKDLHDFFKNYKKIENRENSISIEKDKLCKYVSYIYELYKKHLRDCCEYYEQSNYYGEYCKDYFKCDVSYNPYNLLNKLDCVEKELADDSKNIYEKSTTDRKVKVFTETSLEQYKSLVSNNAYIFNNIIEDPFYFIITFLFSLLGVLFMFFVFYKFTPFGIWVNRSLNRRSLRNKHQQVPPKKFKNINSKYRNMKTQGRRLNIVYQSA
ncbi:variable surface protein [Plasmodium gonderi]|uniref:Variable surface protein n=1 Tax=Plasmodium gonderi TaxID=77519 RepID=A0A1Y1J954_PLAGO|nr:variable surface protein [Plasmodium gonderi]GAW79041.1 variable surface protein [Plasmodium gonderi]